MIEFPDYHLEKTFCDLTSEQLVAKVKARLSEKRFLHCLRTSITAKELALRFGADPDRAAVAGLLHDYAKEIPEATYQEVITKQGFDLDLLNYSRAIWHGVVGVYFIKTELGVTDPAILQAIKTHTTGSAAMTTLDKVVFVADYIEPARDFEGANLARTAAQTDLTAAVGIELRETLTSLVARQLKIYPETIAAYNVYGIETKGDLI